MRSIPKKPFINSLVEGSIDPLVYQDVMKTYAKETITFLEYGNLGITQVGPQTIGRVEFTECEISPFRKQEIDCAETIQTPGRKPSLQKFSGKKIDFSVVQQLLIQSFSPNPAGIRPYPSAGGLYPVEPLVFLFEERIDNLPAHASGCYHFRPVSKKLQCLKKLTIEYFYDKLLHQYMDNNHLPAFGVLYLAHAGKAIFKYRYRGYRHALMEAGSMYQQATGISDSLGLRNTVWSTFSEHEMLHALELEYGTYMPLTMQFFGYGESS